MFWRFSEWNWLDAHVHSEIPIVMRTNLFARLTEEIQLYACCLSICQAVWTTIPADGPEQSFDIPQMTVYRRSS
jgi:hypothetical protein